MSTLNKWFIMKQGIITHQLFVRNSVSFNKNACLALETIMALRQEVTDFVLDYGCVNTLTPQAVRTKQLLLKLSI